MKFAQRKEKVSDRIEHLGDNKWNIDRASIEIIGTVISMSSMIMFFAVYTQFDLLGLHGEFSNTISAVVSTIAPAVVMGAVLFVALDIFTRAVIRSFNRRKSDASVRGIGTPTSIVLLVFSFILAASSLIAFAMSSRDYDFRIAIAAAVALLWNLSISKCIPVRTEQDRQDEIFTEFGPPTDDDKREDDELRRITNGKTKAD